jgi:hypothetical protein
MPTARARMLELSPLPSGSAARTHFLAIVQGGPCPEHDLTSGRLWASPAQGFLVAPEIPGYTIQAEPVKSTALAGTEGMTPAVV